MGSKLNWSGSSGCSIEFEDMGSQFSSFFSVSDGPYSDLPSSTSSNSSLTSLSLTDGPRKIISARMGQIFPSHQAWLCRMENRPEFYLDVQRSKVEHSVSEGRLLGLEGQGKFISMDKRFDADGSGTNLLP